MKSINKYLVNRRLTKADKGKQKIETIEDFFNLLITNELQDVFETINNVNADMNAYTPYNHFNGPKMLLFLDESTLDPDYIISLHTGWHEAAVNMLKDLKLFIATGEHDDTLKYEIVTENELSLLCITNTEYKGNSKFNAVCKYRLFKKGEYMDLKIRNVIK